MSQNKVYITIGRHEHYGFDTAIEREDMLVAYQTGKMLANVLPTCETVYHSPLARAVETARFEALGLGCSHIIETEFLDEDTPKNTVQKFINTLLQNTSDDVFYYHFVTHLPVVEKLGLPFLGAGDLCLLTANSWSEMLAENFKVQVITAPEVPVEVWRKSNLKKNELNKLASDEIYSCLQSIV